MNKLSTFKYSNTLILILHKVCVWDDNKWDETYIVFLKDESGKISSMNIRYDTQYL